MWNFWEILICVCVCGGECSIDSRSKIMVLNQAEDFCRRCCVWVKSESQVHLEVRELAARTSLVRGSLCKGHLKGTFALNGVCRISPSHLNSAGLRESSRKEGGENLRSSPATTLRTSPKRTSLINREAHEGSCDPTK